MYCTAIVLQFKKALFSKIHKVVHFINDSMESTSHIFQIKKYISPKKQNKGSTIIGTSSKDDSHESLPIICDKAREHILNFSESLISLGSL